MRAGLYGSCRSYCHCFILNSSLFMAFFGLGTFPMMLSVSFFGSFINITARQKIRAAYPYLMFIMACLLIIRGLGLGIPYVSPARFSKITLQSFATKIATPISLITISFSDMIHINIKIDKYKIILG